MHYGPLAFGVVFALGTLTWFCLSGTRFPVVATAIFAILTGGAFATVIESTGQPKPLALEWRNVLDAPLVGLSWDEGRRLVWVWVQTGDQPVAYVMPWPADKQVMGQLQDKWRRRGATGDEFKLSMDGDVAKVVPPKQNPEKAQ